MTPAIRRFVVFGAASLFWLLPGHPSPPGVDMGLLHPLNISVLALLWLLCFALHWTKDKFHTAPYAILFVLTALINISFYQSAPVHGLTAAYYANERFEPPIQRSWRFSNAKNSTRIDPKIDFAPLGYSFWEATFPLYFANDSRVRAWKPDSSPDTKHYRFSAEWNGVLAIPPDVTALTLEETGGKAQWWIDSKEVQDARFDIHDTSGRELALHNIRIRFARTSDEIPSLRLAWQNKGKTEAIPSSFFQPAAHTQKSFPDHTTYISYVVFVTWLVILLHLLFKARPIFRWSSRVAFWGIFAVLAFNSLRRVMRKAQDFGYPIFGSGQDWLTYETMARDILFGDWWSMFEGERLGMNFAYRYLLAFMHMLVGESPAAIIWFQQVLMAAVIAFAVWAALRLYGARVAIIFIAIVFLTKQLHQFSHHLLDTTFSIGLGFLTIYFLLEYRRSPMLSWIFLAGLTMGLATLCRANFLPFVLLGGAWILALSPRNSTALVHSLVFCVLALLVFSIIGVRNYLVAGEWVFLPATGLTNLWLGNHPPEYNGPTYFTATVPPKDQLVSLIIDYAVTQPLAFASNFGIKALFILGIDLRNGTHVEPSIIIPWILAIIATTFLLKNNKYKQDLSLLWLWIFTVNVPLAVIFPWGYGWRLSAPSFIPVYLLAALWINYLLDNEKPITWWNNLVTFLSRWNLSRRKRA